MRITLFLLFLTLSLQAQKFTTWSLDAGLPQSQVWSAAADSHGYVWFGTQGGGLSRFDGKQFQTFTSADGLPSNFIHAIFQEKNYRLWIGTNEGIARYNGRKMEALPLKNVQINQFSLISDQKLWAGSQKGIYEINTDSLAAHKLNLNPELDKSEIHAFCQKKDKLWVGTSSGFWSIENLKKKDIATKILDFSAVFAITDAGENQLWLAVFGRGMVLFDTKTNSIVREINNPLLHRPMCIFKNQDQQIWVGTQNNGILCFNEKDSTLLQLSEKDGLPHQNIRKIITDNNGFIWVATSGGGVARLGEKEQFRRFSQENGLSGNRIYAVEQDLQGRIWAAVSQNGAQRLDSFKFKNPLADSLLAGIKCKTLCCDRNGLLWVGTEGRGIFVIDSASVVHLTKMEGLPSDWIQKIIVDAQGQIWVATFADGLAKITRRSDGSFSVKKYGKEANLPDLVIHAMEIDANGKIWLGTQNGKLACLANDKITTVFDDKNGLPNVPFRAIAFDNFG
jgi:ligand-binding sensor domain-containing protein